MKITPALRKAINASVRANVAGPSPLAEVGLRGAQWQPNALLWTNDDDLGDLRRLSEMREINDDPAHPGCAMLDLYVTTGIADGRELETNVYILIRDGQVVGATANALAVRALVAKLNFPKTRGW